MKRNVSALMIVLGLVVACGTGERSTQAPVPLTSTPPLPTAAPATDTPVPPTPPTPTTTPIPPTDAPTLAPALPTGGRGGGVIVFYSNRDGNTDIYRVNADGSDLWRLTDHPANDMAPAVSPDGRQIAFTSGRDGNNEIYVMRVDGSDLRRLTEHRAYDSHPAWSPDGAQIAFVSERDGNREIYLLRVGDAQPDGIATGQSPRRLTDHPADELRPAWSPDGQQIAFNSDRDGNWEIYVVRLDGADLRRLTDSPDWEIFPAWSPDGTRIAYRRSAPRGWNGDVWTMAADGSNPQQITHERSNDENPAWSPDGSQIVFQSDRFAEAHTMGSDVYNFELVVIDADGSHARRLTENPAGDYWPSWGPATR
jgi:Tol biopolymer transport system component